MVEKVKKRKKGRPKKREKRERTSDHIAVCTWSDAASGLISCWRRVVLRRRHKTPKPQGAVANQCFFWGVGPGTQNRGFRGPISPAGHHLRTVAAIGGRPIEGQSVCAGGGFEVRRSEHGRAGWYQACMHRGGGDEGTLWGTRSGTVDHLGYTCGTPCLSAPPWSVRPAEAPY